MSLYIYFIINYVFYLFHLFYYYLLFIITICGEQSGDTVTAAAVVEEK